MDKMDETKPASIKNSASEASNPEITCYIQSVSPIKNTSSNKRKYFDFSLQTRDEPMRALCFLSDKQPEVKTLEQVKSPVKIQNYDRQYQDVLITKHTKIVPLEKDNINFAHSPMCNTDGLLENISSLQKVAAEQVVSVKAEVVKMSGCKTIQTQRYGSLKKQEIIIRDNTSSTKVVLWQEYCDCLELNKTYLLNNLRVKVTKTDKYLNTAKTEKFSFKETEPFSEPLIDVNADLASMEGTTINGKVIGVLQITSSVSCISCKKKVIRHKDSDELGQCEDCKLIQILSSCGTQWYMRILVQSSTNPTEHRKLTMFHQQIQDFMAHMNLTLDLNSVTQSELTVAILKANKVINITYDSLSNKVQAIS